MLVRRPEVERAVLPLIASAMVGPGRARLAGGVHAVRVRVPDGIDLFDPRRYASRGIPYADLARLRAEAPVAWHDEPAILDWPEGPGFWAVTRFEDVSYVSRTPELFSSYLGATQLRDPDPEDLPHIRRMMLNMDPPAHTRLRKIVNTGFTPRRLRTMEPIIRAYAIEVIDRVEAAGGCDFAEDIAGEFPLLTLSEIMGVPRSDRRLLLRVDQPDHRLSGPGAGRRARAGRVRTTHPPEEPPVEHAAGDVRLRP